MPPVRQNDTIQSMDKGRNEAEPLSVDVMADLAAISELSSAVVCMIPTSPPFKMKDDRTTGQFSC